MTDDDKQLTAPYGSWETAKNALQGFAEGVPPRIDRSAFPGLAWNATSRLLGGLRFLGLIDEAGNPLPALHNLADVKDETARKFVVGRVLKERYAEVFKLDLARVTPAHLAEVLGDTYNAKGDTREKAVRFFVSAATYAGIALSPLLTREKGRKSSVPPGRPRRVKLVIPAKPRDVEAQQPTTGATRTVTLESGGTVTIHAAIDFLTLSPQDREFVYGLIDALSGYERDVGKFGDP